MKASLLNTCIVLILASCSAQQKVTVLKIKIIDELKLGMPEANLKISSSDTTINLKTDLDGNIDVKNLKKGLYKISIFTVGHYSLLDYPINIANSNEFIEFEMTLLDSLKFDSVEWAGGWVTLKNRKGNVICVKSKRKE